MASSLLTSTIVGATSTLSSADTRALAQRATIESSGRIGFWRAASLTHPTSERGWLRKRSKFVARAFLHPSLTRRWLARLAAEDVRPLWQLRPRLSTKLQRPYGSCQWEPEQRLDVLERHYTELPQLFSPVSLADIYRSHVALLRLDSASSGRELQVRVQYRDSSEKEGELTLALHDVSTGLTLAGITFSLTGGAAGRTVWIGGLQASPDPRTRGLIHDVAKELHGLRAKALAFWCLQELGQAWDVRSIRAVSDAAHIYRHRHKRREIAACYDEFWAECDGTLMPDGFWELPLRLRARDREELKPSRRKTHERRYAMLANLSPVLRGAAFAHLARQGNAELEPPLVVCFPPRTAGSKSEEPVAAAHPPGASAVS